MSKEQFNSFSSLERKDFSSKIFQKTLLLSKEVVIKNAEEEVVALILSAIVGSIIESWEIAPQDRLSDICSVCKSSDKIQSFRCIHDDNRSMHETYNQSVHNKTSELSNQFINENKSVDKNKSQDSMESNRSVGDISNTKTDISSPSKDSPKNGNVLRLPSIDEEEILQQEITYMSLLEDEKDRIFGWSLLKTNSEVIIQFKQGNRYEGSLLRCRMNGHGKFFWAEGSTYEGDFSNGEMTGDGCLEWPDQSCYEGEMLQGYRHGRGLYIQRPNFYCGEWACGQRHGTGTMFHDHRHTQHNYYNGEWSHDCKRGTGLRSYPSGAVYSGQWASGLRHGLGTMVWLNNDVYSGNWKCGYIHGYGEYTWATFFNNNLAVPQENCFYGNWDRGIRNGNGTLETTVGVVVRGTWKNGEKDGPAQVVCSNGYSVYASNLFVEDCVSLIPHQVLDRDSIPDKASHRSSQQQLYHIPVNAASHEIDLTFYLDRLNHYLVECKRRGKQFKKPATPIPFESTVRTFSNRNDSKKQETTSDLMPTESAADSDVEEVSLRNIILQYLSALKMIYNKYSEMSCDVKPKSPSVLMRLMLWQLFRDCNLHNRGYSLTDFDILIANNKATLVQGVNYPFERLWFWQFLHCLLELSWEFYGKHLIGTPTVKGILASAVHKLIIEDILPNAGRHKETNKSTCTVTINNGTHTVVIGMVLLKYKNLLSLDSVYWFYRGLGEPLPARKLLTSIFVTSEDIQPEHQVKNYTNHNLIHGKNIIGVGGKLSYHPPFVLETEHVTDDSTHPRNLSCLSGIGLLAVSDCLLNVCPSIAFNGLIVNMDYKLVYLEFYEILLSCAKVQAKQKIQERRLAEEETVKNIPQQQSDLTVQDNVSKVEEIIESTTGKKSGKKPPKKNKKST